MFNIAFDAQRRVVWNFFSGVFTVDDIALMDQAAPAVLDAAGEVDCVFDFLGVTAVSVTKEDIMRRGQRPQSGLVKRRVVITQNSEVLKLAWLFGASQLGTGSVPPDIVPSNEEALRKLGLSAIDLKSMNIGGLAPPQRQGKAGLGQ